MTDLSFNRAITPKTEKALRKTRCCRSRPSHLTAMAPGTSTRVETRPVSDPAGLLVLTATLLRIEGASDLSGRASQEVMATASAQGKTPTHWAGAV